MTRRALVVLLFAIVGAARAIGQVAMPDPSQIAGRALPAPDLPDGTVSVRLVRESIGNNIVNQEVTVRAGEQARTGRTDDSGRATLSGLPVGATATAEATVDGEPLVSHPFEVPARGGIRVILIAGLDAAAARRAREDAEAAKAPPVKGTVVFGGESRVVLEFQDDALRVFYLLDIVNTARARVDIGGPLIIDLPTGAAGSTVMQGSFPGATARGDRVTIAGPFPPGTSSVQIGFRLAYAGAETTISQTFPAAFERVMVVAEKVGATHIASPQFTDHGDVKAGDGTPFIMATGGRLAAGRPLTLQLTGLPHHSPWPRNVALALALAILAVGGWAAARGSGAAASKQTLAARRDAIYAELVQLERQHRAGRVDADRYAAARQRLVGELERVYGELDAAPESGRAA